MKSPATTPAASVRAMRVIRVALVDDHQLLRQGLRSLLERQPDIEVVGEAGDGRRGVELVDELHPDIVVLDISMPGLNGIEAMRQLAARPSPPKVIALSMHTNGNFARDMLSAGANGYLLKDSAFDDLVAAIRAIVAGGTFVSPQINAARTPSTGTHPDGNGNGVAPRTIPHALSPREREVLQLMAEGRATKEIAMALHVSVKTIETHRRQLMEKLQLYSVAELTKYAIREGVTSVE